ncbi:ABC transporter permease [Rufibacter quisquiliarum]|uniref:ABC-2 type transport system permease protein n=1 Tax=Rufibacter quisquiliarum TaxID=1549639 RepID=A0A839GDL2_9BACT|nr:ABC transporter permease [Rufibacter quisquiliarum]MBA9077002.1 ABC-2 type transport system permease protein [Rufibacter quisquiliarum]
MDKIWLVFQREYLVRVRKKSFIVMTILGPLLMALVMVVPIGIMMMSDDTKTIQVLDESGFLAGKFTSTDEFKYVTVGGPLEKAKADYLKTEDAALLYIPKLDLDKPEGIQLFSQKSASITVISSLEKQVKQEIEAIKFNKSGINQQVLDQIKTKVNIRTVNLSAEGERSSNAGVTSIAGFIGAFLIYLFIFLYGAQIMRGVIEEKTSRILEVMVSSVKPFQLMAGKIMGIAAVGLTQFLLWIVLTSAIYVGVSSAFDLERFSQDRFSQTMQTMQNPQDMSQAQEVHDIMSGLESLNVPLLVGGFLFYFLGGYLLYGALFGAVGAAVDSETDSQQFMLPITIPLILSFVVAQTIIMKDPNGAVAFWMSMIPFTSPVVMMLRLPFGVPAWELALSMFLLVAGFIGTIWVAARIYRVGILMYGKKITYKELSKWLFYKG